jgi:hypothetical protein
VNQQLPGRNLGYTSGRPPHVPPPTATHRPGGPGAPARKAFSASDGEVSPGVPAAAGFPEGIRLAFPEAVWKPFRELPGSDSQECPRPQRITRAAPAGRPRPRGRWPGPGRSGRHRIRPSAPPPPSRTIHPGLGIQAGHRPGAGEHRGRQRSDFYRSEDAGQPTRALRGVTIGIHQALSRPGPDLGDHPRSGPAGTIPRITLRLLNPTVDEEYRRTSKAHSGRRCSGFNKSAQCPW